MGKQLQKKLWAAKDISCLFASIKINETENILFFSRKNITTENNDALINSHREIQKQR